MKLDSIYDLAKLLALEPSDTLFFEAWPIDLNTCVIRFADRVNCLRVYYKIEELVRFEMLSGGIIMWHGLLVDIPVDYALCDGSNGTPDLRDKFVMGAPNGANPGEVGGAVNHNHTFTGDGHQHPIEAGTGLAAGTDRKLFTAVDPAVGTTDNEDGRPPFYEIAYIMKL